MRYRRLQRYTVISLLIFCSIRAWALDTTLQWDSNTEPDLAGYKVYYAFITCCPDDEADCGNPDNSCLYQGTGSLNGDSPLIMTLNQDQNPDPDLVEYTVYGLPDYLQCTDLVFAVTAYDDQGQESGYSNQVAAYEEIIRNFRTTP